MATAVFAFAALVASPSVAQTTASPFGFTVQVQMSSKARAKLEGMGESVLVTSFYHGEKAKKPTRAEIKRAAADGEDPNALELPGEEAAVAAAGGAAQMTGRAIGPKEAAGWGRNVVNVNVNVISTRRSAQDNLLDCDLFDDAIAKARAKPIVIACRLIGEN